MFVSRTPNSRAAFVVADEVACDGIRPCMCRAFAADVDWKKEPRAEAKYTQVGVEMRLHSVGPKWNEAESRSPAARCGN